MLTPLPQQIVKRTSIVFVYCLAKVNTMILCLECLYERYGAQISQATNYLGSDGQ